MLPKLDPRGAIAALSLLVATSHHASPFAGPASTELGALEKGDTICLLGGALAERMQHHGWLEARLQARFPDLELSFRNLGFGADELTVHQRTMNFGKFTADGMAMNLANERFVPWDRYLEHCGADRVFAFFGYNESFAGEEGLPAFEKNLTSFVDHVVVQQYDDDAKHELVLFSSIPHEDLGDPSLPDGANHNDRIEAYNGVMATVARAKGVQYVDLYAPMAARYAASKEPLTINGIHLTERGNAALAEVIEEGLFRGEAPAKDELIARLREKVLEKNLLWFNRYRATDGYNVYGGRSRQVYASADDGTKFSNFDVLQREMDHLDALAANRDKEIWALARGEMLTVDDAGAPPLLPVRTNKTGPEEGGVFPFLSGEEALSRMTAAPGMKVELFADEGAFPEIANPVQMAWDTKGRLWVAAWPTYPHWTPGQPMNDKLVILEDTDGDGRADKSTVFADDLHNPTGIEFWNGGVFVACAPDLLFLKDIDGDDRADHRERVLHGLSSADTHHAANSFVLGPDGALYFQEGTFHQSQVESIYGPVRNHNGCVWRFEPRTYRVERYIPYNYANPHGHVFDRWGQDFMTDGTGNVNYYALPFSGYLPHPDKHRGYFPFFKQRSRPCAGTEILSSGHFPRENQGNYLIANVITFQGIFQYRVLDDGSGFTAEELDPIVQSTDPNFRPADIEVGPDGAIYFLDWHNPLIGHLQHHIRDPSRDVLHGRVYRVTYEGRELLTPAAIAGEPVPALLELLKSRDDRVRYRARIELSGRATDDVVAAARDWVTTLDPEAPDYEHHLLEALWLHQQHDRMDRDLLVHLLDARDARARAAATRVLRYGRHHLADGLDLLAKQAKDENARVRLEAVVAASFFDSARAASIALQALEHPTDRFLDYAMGETMRALEPRWKPALKAGEVLSADNAKGAEFLLERVSGAELMDLPRIPAVLEAILTRHGPDDAQRLEAARMLAKENGSSPSVEILWAVRRVDAGTGMHAAHVLEDLAGLLFASVGQPKGPARDALAALAREGRRSATRALAYAALVQHDGTVDQAWNSAVGTRTGLASFLEAVPRIADEGLRTSLHERVRRVAFALPASLAAPESNTAGGSGLEVAFFEPAPPNAKRDTFAALVPAATLRAQNFTLDLPPARRSDSFGIAFDGTVFVPKAGNYTFRTRSDDGSRLFIGDRLVVDNDGAHGMVTRDGEIELGAGAHPILVTYFEKGGGEGLEVSWKGPGFDMERIPDESLGGRGSHALRASALRALAAIPGREDEKFADAERLLSEPSLLGPSIEMLRGVPREAWTEERVRPLVNTLAAYVSGLGPEARTSAEVANALELGREIARVLPGDESSAVLEQLDGLGGTVLLVRTLPHQMLYDLDEFWVEAGKPVSIVFQNNDVMPHNFVITAPGAMARVGEAAERLGAAEAEARQYVPEGGDVLWHTRLLYPGESERLTFVAPTDPGEHPYVCTYPGHWRVMNGVMHVVPKLDPSTRLARRSTDEASAPAREFVKNWTMADLLPHLEDGWEKKRSTERGGELFVEAGCIKCHVVDGSGAIGGPELTKIRDKYRGEELLRHVIEPSAEVLEDYRFFGFETDSGNVIGRVLKDDGRNLHVLPALLEPENVTVLPKAEIVDHWDTRLSPMPNGLLVTFTVDEILDLLSFLQSPGKGDGVAAVEAQSPTQDESLWVTYEGKEGLPGNGKTIVLLAGDEEYRSEEAMPMLGRILSQRHGFKCYVLFSTNPETGEIDPDEQTHVPGIHLLAEADMMVCFFRFRELPDEDMKYFVDFVESGKPILGLRTATHAFQYKRNKESPYARYSFRSAEWKGGFGQQVLGDTWISHHGRHGSESTRGVIEPGQEEHPILKGFADVWGPTDVYGIKNLDDEATVLLRGQVLAGMEPTSAPVEGAKNDPMMPLVWSRELPTKDGGKQRVICSTIGASTDCESEGLRRVLVNSCYWGMGLEDRIPAKSNVDYVGEYEPTSFGFGSYTKGVRAKDWALD